MRNPLSYLTTAEIDELYLDPERLVLFAKWANEQTDQDLKSLDKDSGYHNETGVGDALFVKYIKQYAMKELGDAIYTACDVIKEVGPQVLHPKDFQALQENWDEASDLMQNTEISNDETRTYAQILGLKDSSLESIVLIGEHEYREKKYENALAIFFFLSLLDPTVAEFSAKMGVVLSELERHEEAIEAFNKCLEIDTTNIQVRMLRLLSLVEEGRKDLVKEELAVLKHQAATAENSAKWKEYLETLENHVTQEEKHGHS